MNKRSSPKVLVLGSSGQLGTTLQLNQPKGLDVAYLRGSDLDIRLPKQTATIFKEYLPDIVINCAAYTDVDGAEANMEEAYAVNAAGVRNIAEACRRVGARLIHFSTDFVFGGDQSTPYEVNGVTNALNVYGKSKLAGEKHIQAVLPDHGMIIRTSWLYSEHGSNFVKTMLGLFERGDPVRVVSDQVGSPTSAEGLARAIWRVVSLDQFCSGVWHWSDDGAVSWFEFAEEIAQLYRSRKSDSSHFELTPISSDNYPQLAKRPSFSVLDPRQFADHLEVAPEPWRDSLRPVIMKLLTR